MGRLPDQQKRIGVLFQRNRLKPIDLSAQKEQAIPQPLLGADGRMSQVLALNRIAQARSELAEHRYASEHP